MFANKQQARINKNSRDSNEPKQSGKTDMTAGWHSRAAAASRRSPKPLNLQPSTFNL